MPHTILTIGLRTERDVVQARQRARELAGLLGFDNQDQIRLATATSEIARNAFRYAREGSVDFGVILDMPQQLEVTISDSGPGIGNLERVLEGRYKSETGMGLGIVGTKRLMDDFDISSKAGGTIVRMSKNLPRHAALLTTKSARELADAMVARAPESPYEEIERQNQELLKTLQELRARQEELSLLNRELEDTNRGVVALYAELDERADYLRRASELKTKFLSNVSHEFRTPLNSIIALSRMLMDKIDGGLSAEQEKQVRYIESSARDLQEMVNDLLDLAKVEAGKIKIRPKSFDVHELFSALKGMLKPLLADNSSVELVFEETTDLPALYSDEGKVSQILRNLISNSLKFTPKGKVTVAARVSGGDQVVFEVADTGIGIPPEHFETIFREFSQLENPLQDRHRGTGLGLPLCRNLAMLLGGRIWLTSDVGFGSHFFVEIPVTYRGETMDFESSTQVPSMEYHRAPVLIVEDDPQTASIFEAYLRHSEFQPIVARDIASAEVWIARHSPVAIVADVYVGADPAWSFFGSVRDRLEGVPLLAVSAHSCAAEALKHGATLFLMKPVEREQLLNELRRLSPQVESRRLLIVDDNEVSRYIVREILDRPWLDISEANNGAEAMRAIQANRPDALILDLLMPDVSGIEVLRHLRTQPDTLSLPVMVYTSKNLSTNERSELEALSATIVRKEEVSTRLSAKPFLDWLAAAGISPEEKVREQNA